MDDPDQPLLFELHRDKPFRGSGENRARIGNACEEIVTACMGWERQKIDGNREVCVDAKTKEGEPIEIKGISALKGSFKSVIYDFRMEKELREYPNLCYAFCLHNSHRPKSLREVYTQLASGITKIILVPASIVHQDASQEPLNTIKKETQSDGKRNGYRRKGYRDGYRNLSIRRYVEGVDCWNSAQDAQIDGLTFSAVYGRFIEKTEHE